MSSQFAHVIVTLKTLGDSVPVAVAKWAIEPTNSVLMFLATIDAAHDEQVGAPSRHSMRVDNGNAVGLLHGFVLQSGIARCRVWRWATGPPEVGIRSAVLAERQLHTRHNALT